MNFKTEEYLKQKGIKPSLQRIAVMDYLLANKTHPTADEIYNALNPTIPTLSKTTIYNTVNLFVKNEAALRLDIDKNQLRYDGDTSLHGHFRCNSCNMIVDVPIERIENIDPKLLDGFQVSEINVYYKGYCDKCNSNRKRPANQYIN